jgi:hypothetical protein
MRVYYEYSGALFARFLAANICETRVFLYSKEYGKSPCFSVDQIPHMPNVDTEMLTFTKSNGAFLHD